MKSNDSALYQFDAQIRERFGTFCGVDEAGRGPLCGPVCCAAVILDPEDPIEGINDSKKLPTLCRLMSRAARAAEAVGSTVTTLGFIRSLTCIKTALSMEAGIKPV